MTNWWTKKEYYIKTLPKGCCATLELMGKQNPDLTWAYAIVQYSNGLSSLVVEFTQGKEI